MPTIGKYEILEQLGSGSMGTVYKGRDTLLDRMVAIKTIRTGVNVELEAKERFYREARTCARLNHPHIVAVFDLGEENGTSFIAMELLDGADFRQLIERKEVLSVPAKLTVMAQICEALAYAHRAGVIHRDIKPSNLFLPADGRAKIVDFGIAKLPTSHLTRQGSILGTPNYMAPEQIKGLACDGRADLFSAGIVFFEFLTFQHPFKSKLPANSSPTPRMEIPRRIIEEKPDCLLEEDPALPAILEKIFDKALAKNPDNRYATGDDFAADLRAVTDAITQNSSPTFSRVELPSHNSFAVPPPIPNTEPALPRAPNFPVTPVPDNQEWRVNRMLKLAPAFETHLAAKDVQAARNSLTEMQSVAGDDPRYQDPVEACRLRLVQLEHSQSVEAVGKVRCAKCANVNRADAVFCVGCGAALTQGAATGATPGKAAAPPPPPAPPSSSKTSTVPKPPSIPKTQSVPAGPRPTRPAEGAAPVAIAAAPNGGGIPGAAPNPESGKTPKATPGTTAAQQSEGQAAIPPKPSAKTVSDRNKLVTVIGIVAAAVLLLVVAPLFFRSVKQEPYVATAVVETGDARVLAAANPAANVIVTLKRGAQVNVLAVPASLTEGWVRVQARSESKFSEPGFMRLPGLVQWNSKDAKTALALARISGPGDVGTDAEIRSQEDKLKAVAAAFAGKPTAGLANLDAAKLEFTVAKRAKEADPLSIDWRTSMADLITMLENLRKDTALQSSSDDLLKQIHALLLDSPEQPPPPSATSTSSALPPDQTSAAPPPALTDGDVQRYLAAGRRALDESNYKDALAQVRRILRSQPQNTDAKALQKIINDRIAVENSIR